MRGLKILVLKDCHVNFKPNAPETLQTVIIENSVVLGKLNSKVGDMRSCRTFVLKEVKTNYMAFLTNNLKKDVAERVCIIDVVCKQDFDYDPLN
jgi:hypothetical protein